MPLLVGASKSPLWRARCLLSEDPWSGQCARGRLKWIDQGETHVLWRGRRCEQPAFAGFNGYSVHPPVAHRPRVTPRALDSRLAPPQGPSQESGGTKTTEIALSLEIWVRWRVPKRTSLYHRGTKGCVQTVNEAAANTRLCICYRGGVGGPRECGRWTLLLSYIR